MLTALLYLLIFGHVLDDHVQVHGVGYTILIPGLVMMQVLQNAFAEFIVQSDPGEDHRLHGLRAAAADPIRRLFAAYVLAAVLGA